jgi:excisionase family DNA binding protein
MTALSNDMDTVRSSPTVDVQTAARLLGYSKNTAYDAIKDGTFPTQVIRMGGRKIRVPSAALLRVLGEAP